MPNYCASIEEGPFSAGRLRWRGATRGAAHLFLHLRAKLPKRVALPATAPWNAILLAGYCETPAVRWPLKPDILRCIKAIAQWNRNLWRIMLADRFGVAQLAWPERARQAFRLREPPTPYEVACFTMGGGTQGRLKAHPAPPCARAVAEWWLMGAELSALDKVMRWTPGESEQALVDWVVAMMRRPTFSVWALSTDLTPVLPVGLEGGKGRKWQAIMEHPYTRMQLEEGVAWRPVPRVLRAPGAVWKSVSDKETWKTTTPGAKNWQRILRAREILWRRSHHG